MNPATRNSMGTAPNRTVTTARRGWWTSNQGHTNTMTTPTTTSRVPHAIHARGSGTPNRWAICLAPANDGPENRAESPAKMAAPTAAWNTDRACGGTGGIAVPNRAMARHNPDDGSGTGTHLTGQSTRTPRAARVCTYARRTSAENRLQPGGGGISVTARIGTPAHRAWSGRPDVFRLPTIHPSRVCTNCVV